MLSNSQLTNGFWAKVIEIVNYLQNQFSIESKTYNEMISKDL